jgi:hypothetical protein
MVNPGFLKNEDVIAWFGGVEPYWTYLDFDSCCRLRRPRKEDDCALNLAVGTAAAELSVSLMMTAMLHLLRKADAKHMKLTAAGCLRRTVVVELAAIVDGAAFDLSLIRSVSKVLSEQDVWPTELLRVVVVEMRLLLRAGTTLVPTAKGKKVAVNRCRRSDGTTVRTGVLADQPRPLERIPGAVMAAGSYRHHHLVPIACGQGLGASGPAGAAAHSPGHRCARSEAGFFRPGTQTNCGAPRVR